MCQFVRQQLFPGRRMRLILTFAEYNIVAVCVSQGIYIACRFVGSAVVMNYYIAKIVAEFWFHEIAGSRIEGLTTNVNCRCVFPCLLKPPFFLYCTWQWLKERGIGTRFRYPSFGCICLLLVNIGFSTVMQFCLSAGAFKKAFPAPGSLCTTCVVSW